MEGIRWEKEEKRNPLYLKEFDNFVVCCMAGGNNAYANAVKI